MVIAGQVSVDALQIMTRPLNGSFYPVRETPLAPFDFAQDMLRQAQDERRIRWRVCADVYSGIAGQVPRDALQESGRRGAAAVVVEGAGATGRAGVGL